MGATAIIAGRGALPSRLVRALQAAGEDHVVYGLHGFQMDNPDGVPVDPFALERLALLFHRMADRGVTRVCFAGAAARRALEPELIDPATATLLPRLMAAMGQGDDALLREIVALFEDHEFEVIGAHQVAPDLLPPEGVLGQIAPSAADQADAARAAHIVETLGTLDIGQGAVVAQGQCLAVETLPGTDAMLRFAATAARPDPHGARGTFYKAPKPGQDRRVDLPLIGPDTVATAAQAGLAGIALQSGGVMVLDRAETIAAADTAGLFLWVRP